MDIKTLYGLFVLLVFAPLAQAESLALAPDHPDRYVVRKGDTLWDISGHFLKEPWRWPEIWDVNPQIENPHLIYPGDIIYLSYEGGRPRLHVRRGGRPLVRLAPQVRATPRAAAIPAIPLDAIAGFLNHSRVFSDEALEAAPYVVSLGKEHLIGGSRSRVYARGMGPDDRGRYGVYRRGKPYYSPEDEEGEALGYEGLYVATAVLEQSGDPSTLRVLKSDREVLSGDRLFPLAERGAQAPFVPHAPKDEVTGSVISVVDGVTQIGQYQVVVLDLGSRDGMDPGTVLAVWQKGATIYDPYKKRPPIAYGGSSKEPFPKGLDTDIDKFVEGIQRAFTKDRGEPVTLPDEPAGLVMVFRTFDRVSYALVMESARAMHIHDRVANP